MNVAARVTAVLERDGARLISALARQFRDIERAEDAVQEAALRALELWPVRGVPDDPRAWLFTVARHHVLDGLREGPTLEATETDAIVETPSDDRLALLFACCHPAIDPVAQVGLALRTLCGLDTEAVARAFLVSPEAMKRRLSRASNKIRDAGIRFEVPGPRHRAPRVAAVITSIYLLFNEGYAPTRDDVAVRPEVCGQAIDLAMQVSGMLSEEPEVLGVLALMQLHHARREGRVDSKGHFVPLDKQDRGRWHRSEIDGGLSTLDRALALGRPGPFQIQAAIAALHARSPTAADTDWSQITALYGALLQHAPSPIVELNAAVALAMATSPDRGLYWLDRLAERGELREYHLFYAVRGDLLERMGRSAESHRAFQQALEYAKSPSDKAVLAERLRGVRPVQRRRRTRRGDEGAPLSNRDWSRVKHLFERRRGRGRPSRPPREQLAAIIWILTSGRPWRDLPERFGPWRTAYHRFRSWENDGRLGKVFGLLARHPVAGPGRAMGTLG